MHLFLLRVWNTPNSSVFSPASCSPPTSLLCSSSFSCAGFLTAFLLGTRWLWLFEIQAVSRSSSSGPSQLSPSSQTLQNWVPAPAHTSPLTASLPPPGPTAWTWHPFLLPSPGSNLPPWDPSAPCRPFPHWTVPLPLKACHAVIVPKEPQFQS